MRIHRMPATLASVVALAACAVTLTATPAGASGAANPCGSGYKLVGSYTIAKDGTKYGTLEVRWSAATGKNCALAYGFGANYGRADYKSVRIETTGSTRWADTDWGDYKYYAGPVYVSARNTCINVAAHVRGTRGTGFVSKRSVHCG
ncbi:spore-associated protein A [Nonomuraea rubra]|uniref:Spore-associated protein A n=1 Tax=Nonomuraea rubra TaxID=46180 RepID=A0A7X0NVD6_9ACTN|nr:spore-associated protein A [Nonomuraea rubra]MBB6550346.1 hypothetical protein [Nonomuraea rubra]